MTSIPDTSDDSSPQEWSIGNRTLILSAGSQRPLAVLNGRYPLLLSPGSMLQLDDPPEELVVTKLRLILGDGGGVVCAEVEPAAQPERYRASAAPSRQAEPPRHLRSAPGQLPRWSRVRPGNG
jgi:hypothetical protein